MKSDDNYGRGAILTKEEFMAIGPLVKVNPNEKPTEYLARVQSAGSDGGKKITRDEAAEGRRHLGDWETEKFSRLTTLPAPELTKELRAIKEMQKLPKGYFGNSSMVFAGWGGIDSLFLVTISIGVSLGLAVIHHNLEDIRDAIKNKNSSQLIDTLEAKLKGLDDKLAKGEIKKEDYEKERRKIIEEVIGSH